MGKLDIGLAMVAARLATSEMEKDQEVEKRRQAGTKDPAEKRRRGKEKASLSGVKLEVINGELILIPSAESPVYRRARGWSVTPEDAGVVRLDPAETASPQETE